MSPTQALGPAVLDDPPADVATALEKLRDGLDQVVPEKALDRNLLIATWNLRAFGGLTEAWRSGEHDSPKRDLADIRAIAEVLSRFDVIAVQEVRGDLKALRHTLKVLGPDWGLILTDVTRGHAGNDERLAFLYDTRRVKPSGLACELVVPLEEIAAVGTPGALDKQFARTPYAVSFISARNTFTLVTLHVVYGEGAADRVGELKAIAEWLARWAGEMDDYGHNLMLLGDFNIDRANDPNYRALTSTGLRPPLELEGLPRTTSDKPGKQSFYDQIAWFTESGRAKLSLRYDGHAGNFLWTDYWLTDVDGQAKTWHISDHYPLWVEFLVRLE